MTKRALREALGLVTGEKQRPPRTNYKQRADDALTMGYHPATGRPLRRDLGTCGDCAHHVVRVRCRTYHKCELHRLGTSSSEASDIRVSWPACAAFAPAGSTAADVGGVDA